MKFRFIGDPNDNGSGPGTMTMHGLTFNRTDWTDVTDAEAIRQMKTHTHFESSEMGSGAEAHRRVTETNTPARRDAETMPHRTVDDSRLQQDGPATPHPTDPHQQPRQNDANRNRERETARDEANRLAAERAAKARP